MIELSPSGKANFVAVAAIIGILGALVLVWRASNHEAADYGPTAVTATADGTVYFVAGGTLFSADSRGRLLDRVPLKTLGIQFPVAHMAGLKGTLLIADGGAIWRCNVARQRCSQLLSVPVGSALALAVAPETERLYVSNVSRHRIYAFDLHGKQLYRLVVPGGVRFANDIRWLGNGHLLIADTNHHRVIEVNDPGDGHAQLVQNLNAENASGRSGRTWPTATLRDGSGRIWVIDGNGMLRDGDLIVYGKDGHAERRISLGASADPMQLTLLPDAVLVSDETGYRLQQVALSDYRVSVYGDAALRAALAAIKAERRQWHDIYRSAFGILVLFALLGGLAGYLDWRERRLLPAGRQPGVVARPRAVTRPPSLTAAMQMKLRPDAQGITWLAIVPRTIRLLRVMAIAFPALMLLMVGAFIYTTHGKGPQDMKLIGMMIGVAAFIAIVSLWSVRIFKRIRIGTDGSKLYLVDFRGRRAQAEPEQCLNTGRRLLIGNISVPIANNQYQMFDKQELAALIGPLLERVPKSGELTMLWQKLRSGDPATWVTFIGFIAVVVLRIWLTK